MQEKETGESERKKKWATRLFIYAVFVFVGYQIFVLIFNSGALTSIGLDSSNFQIGGFSLHSGANAPQNGGGKVTGLPLTTDGYNSLLQYDQTIQLSNDQKQQYAGFDVFIPCCGFKLTSTDENQDCRCGHHIALSGLIKYGLTHDASRTDIQTEINQWKPVFFPVCLQQPSLCDLQ